MAGNLLEAGEIALKRSHPRPQNDQSRTSEPFCREDGVRLTSGSSFVGGKGILCLIALVALVGALYLPLPNHSFHELWDDGTYITKNPHVAKGLTAKGAGWAFSDLSVGFYYPLTWISHMFDVSLFGMKPHGHYLTSILLHGLITVLLFLLLGRATGRIAGSFFFSALFAVHPMNVETVAWLSERKNLLSAMFLLLAVWAYCKGAMGSRPFAWMAHLFFIMGLMSKSNIVMFPFLLVFVDIWPLGRISFSEGPFSKEFLSRAMNGKWLFLIPSAVFGMLTVIGQKWINAIEPLSAIPAGQRIGEALIGYGFYLLRFFLPFDLCALYPHHRGNYPAILPLSAALLLAVITAIAIRFRKQAPALAAGWGFFLVSLLPVIGFMQVGLQGYADRYVYFPYWGLSTMAVFGLPWQAIKDKGHVFKMALPAAAGAVIVLFFGLSRVQLSTWKDDETLFKRVIAVSPRSDLARYRLGNYYELVMHDPAKAVSQYEKALELKPGDHEILNNMAGCSLALGVPEKALDYAGRAIASDPSRFPARYNRACALVALHREDEAMREALEASALSREGSGEKEKMSLLFAAIGNGFGSGAQFEKAEEAFRLSVKEDPKNGKAWCSLGYSLDTLGKDKEARSAFAKSVEIDPCYDIPLYQLALIDLRESDISGAADKLGSLKKMGSPLAQALEEDLAGVSGR